MRVILILVLHTSQINHCLRLLFSSSTLLLVLSIDVQPCIRFKSTNPPPALPPSTCAISPSLRRHRALLPPSFLSFLGRGGIDAPFSLPAATHLARPPPSLPPSL